MKPARRCPWITAILTAAILAYAPQFGLAAEVTVAFVTPHENKTVSIADRHAIWKSPFGGWVVATWPYTIAVNETPIIRFQTEGERIATTLNPPSKPKIKELGVDDLLKDIQGKSTRNETASTDGSRQASATLQLPVGRHVIDPFGIEFTIANNGTLNSLDQRVQIDSTNCRIEVVCHPVVVKTFAGSRSVQAPLRVRYGSTALLEGMEKQLSEFETKHGAAAGSAQCDGLRRLTLYLPASKPGTSYTVNDTSFEVSTSGEIRLAENASARCLDGHEIHLFRRDEKSNSTQQQSASERIGVAWFNSTDEVKIVSGSDTIAGHGLTGSVSLAVPTDRTLLLGKTAVRLPSSDARFPHLHVLWDADRAVCWSIEASPLVARPGSDWSCRVTSLTTDEPFPSPPTVWLEAGDKTARESSNGMELKLTSRGRNEFSATLPNAPGLWRISAGLDSALVKQPLGLVLIAAEDPMGAISFYTHHNYRVVRRSDPLDIFWSSVAVSALTKAVEFPIVLRGNGLTKILGQLTLSPVTDASGSLRLDTTLLPPGRYEIGLGASGPVVYSVTFHVVQREPVSDFELYSYVFGPAKPFGGSPVTGYYGAAVRASEPGLAPYLAEVSAALDPALASFSTAPLGPAVEKFSPPTDEEAALLALTRLGMRAVPRIPPMLHHEEWNPKHTLAEDVAGIRRRLALFAQPRADLPSFSGIELNWFGSRTGYWEESPPLDGHQTLRNAEMKKWIAEQTEQRVTAAQAKGIEGAELETLRRRAEFESANQVLPRAYAEFLTDAKRIRSDLTAHSAVPSFWFNQFHPPLAFTGLTQRDSIDYTDYGVSPWGNFRAPAFLNMGNPTGQKLQCNFMTAGRHSRIATAFAAAGRGLDGLSLKFDSEYPEGEDRALLDIFQRFGSYFSALEPLPDVAVYFNGWQQQKSVVLHDLARLRRPGMLLAPEDVLAGRLKPYKVLILAGVGAGEPKEILAAFQAFEATGGMILKDRLCHTALPGRDLGLAYDEKQLHNGWGLGGPNGEWEFAHLWKNFKEHRERPLLAAFTKVPGIPVATPDENVVLSPLAGKESICCFVVNQTLVPLSVEGKWRQHAVLPRRDRLQIGDGWHVHDLLAGTPLPVENSAGGRFVPLDFTRMEGAIYLLTKHQPQEMKLRTERISPQSLRSTAWLVDSKGRPLADPMPFEVTLRDAQGVVLFHKFTALSPERTLDVPLPTLPSGTALKLTVRDLILGRTATQRLEGVAETGLPVAGNADFVGGEESTKEFLLLRKGRVTILLDEGQESFRRAADELAKLLRRVGRESRILAWDPADVRPLPLRWKPTEADQELLAQLRGGRTFASRVPLGAVATRDKKGVDFADPQCGYAEYGPQLRFDGDLVVFGLPENHLALGELKPYLRRVPTTNYPLAGGYFVHHLRSPFQAGFDGLYISCRDAAGAEAAIARLAELRRTATMPPATTNSPRVNSPAAESVLMDGQDAGRPDNQIVGKFGSRILDVAYAPKGQRIFVTVDSYGDSLFVLDASGAIIERRALHNRCGNNLYWQKSGMLRPIDDESFWVRVGSGDFRYSLDRGFLSRIAPPPTGFTGRFKVPIAAATLLEDDPRNVSYQGGARYLNALSTEGRLLWTYDDSGVRTDTDALLYPRCLFPRAVSGDGRVLLVAAFGIKHDVYALGSAVNASIFGLEAATGKLLWQRDNLLLNQGKALAIGARFLIVDDNGETHVINAVAGTEAGRLRSVQGTDWIVPVPGRNELLIVENNSFDRLGPTAKVYLRPLTDEPDRPLPVAGRVTDVAIGADGRTLTLASARGVTSRFSIDGELLWQSSTPSGGLVRLSPNNRFVLVGRRDGVLQWLNAADGAQVHSVDFNPFNVTDGERFIRQLGMLVDVPMDEGFTIPAAPPELSYRDSLSPKTVMLGKNLIADEALRAALKPVAMPTLNPTISTVVGRIDGVTSFTFPVEAGKTYLVELLGAIADAKRTSPQTRLEVAVRGPSKSTNLPFVGRFPLSTSLTRRRAAFRADATCDVTLTLRAVEPVNLGDAKKPRLSYDPGVVAECGFIVGDLFVAALNFPGHNLIFDGGPEAKTKRAGNVTCLVKPWTGGNSTVRHEPYSCPLAAQRISNGVLTDPETAWTTEVRGTNVEHAEAKIRLVSPQQIGAFVLFEDSTGPIAVAGGVSEKTSPHYGLYVREAATQRWRRIAYVAGNTQLVNIFPSPATAIDEVRYFWAGRNDAAKTDGLVRMAEFEIYSADAISDILDNVDALPGKNCD